MKALITGGLGFVGFNLSRLLLEKGYEVVSISTSPRKQLPQSNRFQYLIADTTKKGQWQNEIKDADVIVNLAGKTIFNRWNQNYKDLIYSSRILTTRNVVDAIPEKSSKILINASAAGFYGNRGEETLDEYGPSGNDFLSHVCVDWENESFLAKNKGVRVAAIRLGVVLGKNGGAMEKMIPAFKLFVGGPLGNGMHWFPWIHLQDLLNAIVYIIDTPALDGPINMTSPNPVRNKIFAKTMGDILKRPSVLPAPAFIMRIVLGELGAAFLNSQRVVPSKLLNSGFSFRYPDLKSAITDIVTS